MLLSHTPHNTVQRQFTKQDKKQAKYQDILAFFALDYIFQCGITAEIELLLAAMFVGIFVASSVFSLLHKIS